MSEAKRDDGGCAFPSPGLAYATDGRQEQRDGMSLRDYFAAHVFVTREEIETRFEAMHGVDAEMISADARTAEAQVRYLKADVMLAERSKTNG